MMPEFRCPKCDIIVDSLDEVCPRSGCFYVWPKSKSLRGEEKFREIYYSLDKLDRKDPLVMSWKPNVANPKEDKVTGKRFVYKVLAFEPRTEEVLFNQDIFASDEAEAMLKADISSIAKAKNLNPKYVETRFMKWAEFDEPTLDDRADSFLQKLDGLSGGDSENALALALLSKLGVKPKADE